MFHFGVYSIPDQIPNQHPLISKQPVPRIRSSSFQIGMYLAMRRNTECLGHLLIAMGNLSEWTAMSQANCNQVKDRVRA